MSTFTFNGHTYEVITNPLNWQDAKAYAMSRGAQLVVINSQSENNAVFAQVLPLLSAAPTAADGGGSAYVWLGASDAETEGNWVWTDGTSVSTSYSTWGSGVNGSEPDNYKNQDAMAMGLEVWPKGYGGYGVAGQWNDIDDTNTMFFVMEFDPLAGNNSSPAVESAVSYTLRGSETSLRLIGTAAITGKGNVLANSLTGNDGNNKLYGLEGDDHLTGGLGGDLLDAGDGNDTLDGGVGSDKLTGGRGDDIYIINDASKNGKVSDVITEKPRQGSDVVWSNISITLPAEIESLLLTQAENAEGIGNKLSNSINGNAGANVLDGKQGNDTLAGGEGSDRFLFTTKVQKTDNVDEIQDFTPGSDQLVLSKKLFVSLKGITLGESLPASAFAVGAAAGEADDRVIYDELSGKLFYDPDGSGAKSPIQFAVLTGMPSITASDIQII